MSYAIGSGLLSASFHRIDRDDHTRLVTVSQYPVSKLAGPVLDITRSSVFIAVLETLLNTSLGFRYSLRCCKPLKSDQIPAVLKVLTGTKTFKTVYRFLSKEGGVCQRLTVVATDFLIKIQ
jgi:hypothetical protein